MKTRAERFGITLRELHDKWNVTWSAHEAREILSSLGPECERMIKGRLHVYLDGRWREVYRVDLFDQVSTYRDKWTLADYINAIVYGVRIHEDGSIGIIDSTTDG